MNTIQVNLLTAAMERIMCQGGSPVSGSGGNNWMNAGWQDSDMGGLLQKLLCSGNLSNLSPQAKQQLAQDLFKLLKDSHGHGCHKQQKVQQDIQKLIDDLQQPQGNQGGQCCHGNTGSGDSMPVDWNPGNDCHGGSSHDCDEQNNNLNGDASIT